MNDLTSQVKNAKAFVSARMSEMEHVLDDYPAADLLEDCLKLDGSGAVVDRRAQALFVHIVSAWVRLIEHDLQRMPPATIELQQTIRQRMLDARDALLRVRLLLDALTEFAPNRAEPAETVEGRRAEARDLGGALANRPKPFEREVALHSNPRPAVAPVRRPSSVATHSPAYQTASARP